MIAALATATGALILTDRCSHRPGNPFGPALPPHSGGDTIDVAIEVSPLSYSLAGDTIAGLDYDMMRDMALANGRPVKFHPFAPLQYALQGLADGNFDIVISSLPSTVRLKDNMLLTDAVYLDRQVLVQRTADTAYISRAEQLAGREVWIADGSPLEINLRNLSAEIGDTIIVRSKPGHTAEHLLMLLAADSVPNAVVNEGLARSFCAGDTSLSFDTPVSFTQFQAWAVAPGNTAMHDMLNKWLKAYRHTPAYAARLAAYGMRAPH